MKDKKILIWSGIGAATLFLLSRRAFAEELAPTTPEIEKAKATWRQTGEIVWSEVAEACMAARQGIDGAKIYIASPILKEPFYKETFVRTSTLTQMRLTSFWQSSMNLDLSSAAGEVHEALRPQFDQVMKTAVISGVWGMAEKAALAQITSAIGLKAVSSAITKGALLPTGPIGWVVIVAMQFLPTPGFLSAMAKVKVRIRGAVAVPFPDESLRILRYINAQNSEYLYCCDELQSEQEGLFVLRRLLTIAEKTEPLAQGFGVNKFLEACRLSGFTSLSKPLSDLNFTIATFCQKFKPFAVPWDCTMEDTPVWLTETQPAEIIRVGSNEYNRRWEAATGRKVYDPIELPTQLPREVSPVSGLPSYGELLFAKPVRPPMAIPEYRDIRTVLCDQCQGKGFTIQTEMKRILFKPSKLYVDLRTCSKCGGVGFVDLDYGVKKVV